MGSILLNRSVKYYSRKIHAWASIIIAIPTILIFGTGVLLLLKKQIHWVQPPTIEGSVREPNISFETIMRGIKQVKGAKVSGWGDVKRLDILPGKGVMKVHLKNSLLEIQLDLGSGKIVQAATRASDVIEALHDGSWFHDSVKLFVFLPVALILIGLWFTGVYLFFLPSLQRRLGSQPSLKPGRATHRPEVLGERSLSPA